MEEERRALRAADFVTIAHNSTTEATPTPTMMGEIIIPVKLVISVQNGIDAEATGSAGPAAAAAVAATVAPNSSIGVGSGTNGGRGSGEGGGNGDVDEGVVGATADNTADDKAKTAAEVRGACAGDRTGAAGWSVGALLCLFPLWPLLFGVAGGPNGAAAAAASSDPPIGPAGGEGGGGGVPVAGGNTKSAQVGARLAGIFSATNIRAQMITAGFASVAIVVFVVAWSMYEQYTVSSITEDELFRFFESYPRLWEDGPV